MKQMLHERLALKPLEDETFKGLDYLTCRICIENVSGGARYFRDHSGPYCPECYAELLQDAGEVVDYADEDEE